MKYLHSLCMRALVIAYGSQLAASSITAYDNQTAYQTTNHVFSRNDIAQGFVRLNNGFTVMPNSCVTMDMLFSVSGGIDLRETSTIRLLKDLEFDRGVTLTTGGNIDGRGHALILNGDFRIPAGKVLHFNGDTIIDAQGHEIMIGESAEIFVDTNVTLTIANAIIKSTRNAPTFPALRLAALTSKLALDNVVFMPGGDFWFQQGQLFVHNDVLITGTSSFVYHSPMPSFIAPSSCLCIDNNVTLSIAPATFTDAPYTLKNTYTDCNFIKMADETSGLYLNGGTLQITNTGLRLVRGMLLCDGPVDVKTEPVLTLASLTLGVQQAYGYAINSMHWSPNGRYLAVGGQLPVVGHELLEVYSFDGTSLVLIAQVNYGTGYGSRVNSVNWSPDGRYLAVAAISPAPGLEVLGVYSFDGLSLTLLTQVDYGNHVQSLNWSPDGCFLAVGGRPNTAQHEELEVYRFDGTALISIVGSKIHYGSSVYVVSWSPDGCYIAIGSGTADVGHEELEVYSFNGGVLTLLPDTQVNYGTYYASYVLSVSWSPDGRYLAIGGMHPDLGHKQLEVYRFDGIALVLLADAQIDYGFGVYSVQWSPDGHYLAIGGQDPASGHQVLESYIFNGTSLELVTQVNCGASVKAVSWRSNGLCLAVGNYEPTVGHQNLEIYFAGFIATLAPQSLTSGIVFGDQTKGSAYDVHLRLMPGASLNLTGRMLYDNVDGLMAEG